MPELAPRRQRVIDSAETWIDTPFLHATCIKGRGVDCIMLLAAVFAEAGVLPFVDPRPYPRAWFVHRDEERYLIGLEKLGRPIAHPQPGDVGVWKFGRCYSHGALLVTPFIDDINPLRRKGDVIHGKVQRAELIHGDLLVRPVKWFDPYPILWPLE